MKRFFILSLAILFLLGFAPSVNAILIDIDNTFFPSSFSFDGIAIGGGDIEAGSGYDNMVDYTGSTLWAFNPGIPPDYIEVESPSNVYSTEIFDLTSFLIAGAWGNQTLLLEGLLGGNVIYSSELAVSTNVQIFEANWYSLDQFRITIDPNGIEPTINDLLFGGNWVVDNIVINENVAPVPEPSTIVLMGLGLIGLAGLGRVRMKR